MKNRSFKIFYILAPLIIIIGLAVFFMSYNKETEVAYLTSTEFYEKIENQEEMMIVYTLSTCAHCASYKPTLHELKNSKNLDNIYLVELDSYNDTDYQNIITEYGLESTPTSIIFKNYTTADGNEIYGPSLTFTGSIPYTELIEKLNTQNFIK